MVFVDIAWISWCTSGWHAVLALPWPGINSMSGHHPQALEHCTSQCRSQKPRKWGGLFQERHLAYNLILEFTCNILNTSRM